MRTLSLDDFQERAGQTFKVDHGGREVDLVLKHVVQHPSSSPGRDAFRLEWVGPLEPALLQGTYAFSAGDEPVDIFIVPVGRDDEGMRYEAIFN